MKKFKIIMAALLVTILTASLTSCGGSKPANGTNAKITLNVFNWGDYIAETTVDDFQAKYPNINVNYETFTTNEDMYVRIKAGGSDYDVAIPSDYMIKRMLDERMLNKINMSNIPNYKLIGDRFKNLSFDPANEYSVPYMWGTVGILYNKTMVKEKVDSWKILWDKKYAKQILIPDSERDSIGITLKMLGYSMNTKNIKELEEAKKALMEQKPLVLAYVVDEVKDKMIEGEAALSVVWSGDAFYCMGENKDLDYVIPKEGSNLWFDSMVIPNTSKHQKEAELFINFMCDTETAYKNAEYIGYASPQTEAIKKLDPTLTGNKNAYPDVDDLKNAEIFEYPGDELNKEYSRIWTEIKAN
jgi:Spermidine/putrescine-binding periplasmic protein